MMLPAPIKASAETFKQFREAALKKRSNQVQELKKPLVQAEKEPQSPSQKKERFVTIYVEVLFCISLCVVLGGLHIQVVWIR